MEKLSERLKCVASFVPPGARLLDVGSDHAYLPLYLLAQGQISSVIAGEVVEGPYQSACANVAASSYAGQVQVRLADGLAAFNPEDGVTCITIAGMGGRLIAEILDKGRAKLGGVDRLILQPNNREDDLRSWLAQHKFQLVTEQILSEHGKYYEILVVEPGEMTLTSEQLRFGPYLMQEKSEVFLKKWKRERDKLTHALQQIPATHTVERSALLQKIQQIEEVCHVSA